MFGKLSLALWLKIAGVTVAATAIGTGVYFSAKALNKGSGSQDSNVEVASSSGDGGPSSKVPVTGPRHEKLIDWKFKKAAQEGADLRDFDTAEAAKIITDKLAGATPENYQPTRELFEKYSWNQIKDVADAQTEPGADGKVQPLISKELSDLLAGHRRALINQTLVEALKKFDPEGRYHAGALDSGNKESGISSDVDATIFLLSQDLEHTGPMTSEQIKRFIGMFEEEFKRLSGGKTPEWYGIECMNGADFYPDWYSDMTVAEFEAEADRVHGEKMPNNEAYHSRGQLKSQAEGRGYESLREQIAKLEALERAQRSIAQTQASDIPADKKLAAIRWDAQVLLKKVIKGVKLDDYPVKSIKDAVDILKLADDNIKRNSPWTEVYREDGNILVSQTRSPRNKVLPNKPEFAKQFAFDGAWDNWIMYEVHEGNRTKYLIRSVAEGSGVLFQVMMVTNAKGSSATLTPMEYDVLFNRGSHQILGEFVKTTYGHLDAETQRRFKMAMDTAAAARLQHKGKEPYKSQTEKQIFGQYVVEAEKNLTASERKLPPDKLDTLLTERGQQMWEADAREIMLENMMITSDTPVRMLNGGITEADLARIRELGDQFKNAKLENLEADIRKQLEHAFIELMTSEHARDLVNHESSGRTADVVDRILRRFRGTKSEAQLNRIAHLAAVCRVELDVDVKKRAEFHEEMHKELAERLSEDDKLAELARDEREQWDKVKEGHEPINLSEGLIAAAMQHYRGKSREFLERVGFEVKTLHQGSESGLGIGKWDPRPALEHMVTVGGLDSALEVLRVYVEQGDIKAALKAAGWQLVLIVPYVPEAQALYDLVEKGNVSGVVLLGSGYLEIPAIGEAYMIANIVKNTVVIYYYAFDYAFFKSLRDDLYDKTYQGFLDKQAGIVSTGTKEMERSRRPSLLAAVTPLRVIPYAAKDKDGKPLKDAQGRDKTYTAFAVYSFDEAVALGFLEDSEPGKMREDYDWLKQWGVLGGGKLYDDLLKQANDEDANPKLNFAARQASLYFAYEKRALAVLKAAGVDIDNSQDAYPLIKQMFRKSVDSWLKGTEEFANRVDGEVNLLIADKVETIKDKLAERMASDFLWSYAMIRGGDRSTEKGSKGGSGEKGSKGLSIEQGIKAQIKVAREKRKRIQTGQMLLSYLTALKPPTEPELGRAAADVVASRWTGYRVPGPRIHVRPAIFKALNGDGKEVESAKCRVSVVVDPGTYPPTPGGAYPYDVTWETFRKEADWFLRVLVEVKDDKGQRIGMQQKVVGTLDAVETGPMTIAGGRDEKNKWNRIDVTCEALAKLDPKSPNEGLSFTLYRSQSPEGPFQRLADLGARTGAFPDDVFMKPETELPGRLAKNKVRLVDADVAQDDPKRERKPMYYQVGMRSVQQQGGAFQEVGDEVRSPVSTLGDPIVSVSGVPEGPDAVAHGTQMNVALSLSDQMFDVAGADFEVTSGKATWHFYAPRTDGKQVYGSSTRWNEAKASIEVPFRPEGQTITIMAHGGGHSATRTLKVETFNPQDDLKLRDQSLQACKASLDQELQELNKTTDTAKKDLGDTEAELNKLPKGSADYLQALKRKDVLNRIAFRRWWLQTCQLNVRAARMKYDDNVARAKGDWQAVLAVEQAFYDLNKEFLKTNLQRVEDELAANRFVLPYIKDAAQKQRDTEEAEKTAASAREAHNKNFKDGQVNRDDAIAVAALQAGNEAAYRAAVNERLEAFTNDKRAAANQLASKAGGIVLLTGNRGEGKQLLTKSRALMLEILATAEERKRVEDQWARDPLPAWWP